MLFVKHTTNQLPNQTDDKMNEKINQLITVINGFIQHDYQINDSPFDHYHNLLIQLID